MVYEKIVIDKSISENEFRKFIFSLPFEDKRIVKNVIYINDGENYIDIYFGDNPEFAYIAERYLNRIKTALNCEEINVAYIGSHHADYKRKLNLLSIVSLEIAKKFNGIVVSKFLETGDWR